jgi:hypothetical protein
VAARSSQPQFRRCPDAAQFTRAHALGSTTEAAAPALPYFNEHDRCAISHHEVYLSETTAEVALKQPEARLLQQD